MFHHQLFNYVSRFKANYSRCKYTTSICINYPNTLKQLTSRCSKIYKKNENIIKLTVNTGQVMFSGEIYY